MNLSVFTVAVSAGGILLSIWIIRRYKALSYLQSYGIPCPIKPHFLYGNLHELRWSKKQNIQEKQAEWLKNHGKIVGYYMGLKPRIMIADLDLLKEILVKNINIFTNRPDVPRGMPTLVSLRDKRWKEVRHILTPTFSLLKLKAMLPTMKKCTDLLTEILNEKPQDVDIEIYEPYQALTLDVICRCALALELNCQKDSNDDILNAVRKFFRLDLSRIVIMLVCFPGLRSVFRMLFRFAPSNKLIAFVLNHVRVVVERRRSSEETPVLIDALHLLLEASEGKHSEESTETSGKKVLLNDDEIAWNACVFLLAGYETTSTALAYITYCLSLYPEEQEKIFNEMVEKLGSDQTALSYDDVSQLQYLELVIMESLRLYPPVPLFVSRECNETTVIKGLTIPVDAVVDVPVWSIHRDPELWNDPETFDPLRHLPEEKSKRHSMAYLPFGAGPRNCIGGRFAMLEMKVTLAQLVRQFVIKPSERNRVPLPTTIRTNIMNPTDGVWIKLEKR